MEEKVKTTSVTKQETLAALRHPGELYALISAATRMPFVRCDEETFDDEILLYYRAEDAKEMAKQLGAEKYHTVVVKLEEKQLLGFYTSLFTMDVNGLAVNVGTDTEIHIQLGELVTRKKPDQLPEGKQIVENPALHLTALYYMQELRRRGNPEPDAEIRELQEELLAHYQKGTYLIAVEENGQLPILKQKDGSVYQPVFTDLLELQKFSRGRKMKLAAVPAEKIPASLVPAAKGIAINPLGVNVQLQINRPAKPQTQTPVPDPQGSQDA